MSILSKSLMMDPFAIARQKFENKGVGEVLSKSAAKPVEQQFNPANGADVQAQQGLGDLLQRIGVSNSMLSMNQIGRFQLIGRLRAKLGDNYMDNPDAKSAMEMFDNQIAGNPAVLPTQTLSASDRTLGFLLKKPGGFTGIGGI